jgi:hypothetical protein
VKDQFRLSRQHPTALDPSARDMDQVSTTCAETPPRPTAGGVRARTLEAVFGLVQRHLTLAELALAARPLVPNTCPSRTSGTTLGEGIARSRADSKLREPLPPEAAPQSHATRPQDGPVQIRPNESDKPGKSCQALTGFALVSGAIRLIRTDLPRPRMYGWPWPGLTAKLGMPHLSRTI